MRHLFSTRHGYLHISPDGTRTGIARCNQGTTSNTSDVLQYAKGLPKAPGLYRARYSFGRGGGQISDIKPVDAAKELARLDAMVAKAQRRYRTPMPGIKGYLEHEHAVNGSIDAARQTTSRIRDWVHDKLSVDGH